MAFGGRGGLMCRCKCAQAASHAHAKEHQVVLTPLYLADIDGPSVGSREREGQKARDMKKRNDTRKRCVLMCKAVYHLRDLVERVHHRRRDHIGRGRAVRVGAVPAWCDRDGELRGKKHCVHVLGDRVL